MICPDCNKRLGCRDTRAVPDGVRRIYHCSKCGKKHYTIERFRDPSNTNSQFEQQIRDKVKQGLADALAKL